MIRCTLLLRVRSMLTASLLLRSRCGRGLQRIVVRNTLMTVLLSISLLMTCPVSSVSVTWVLRNGSVILLRCYPRNAV